MKKIGLLLVTGLLSLNLLQAQDRRRPLENPEEPVLQERRVQRDAEEIQEELFEHARRGNLQQVQELVAELRGRNENINPADARGETPLHYAAENGHIETVQFLVEAVREINIYVDTLPADDAGWTPLHAAARYGHEEVVRFLVNAAIDRGEDWGCDNEDGNTPLHLAAQSGAINVVRLLIGELGATIWDLNPINNQGRTPVHLAVEAWEDSPILNGNIEVIRFLVEEVCVDISVKDNAGRTAEELAIHINSSALDDEHQRCRFEMIRILNAAVNSISSRQRPLYTIYSELLVNSYRGDLQKVEALIGELKNCNADINLALKQTNGIGYSPLRLAVNEDHTDVVRFLTDIWPDIEGDFNSEARDFLTPLHQAVDARNVEIVEILICALQRLNRDINTPNNEGVTLLELAACNGCVEVVQILVAAMSDRNEDINMINHKGDTLLHAVVRSCENPVIDRVLGWRRSISNKIRVIDFLVNNGVDVFIKNRDGETAAERAVRCLRGMLEEAEYDQLLIVLLASFPVVMK